MGVRLSLMNREKSGVKAILRLIWVKSNFATPLSANIIREVFTYMPHRSPVLVMTFNDNLICYGAVLQWKTGEKTVVEVTEEQKGLHSEDEIVLVVGESVEGSNYVLSQCAFQKIQQRLAIGPRDLDLCLPR